MHKFLLNSFVLLVSSVLVACGGGGGGGGGGSDDPAPAPESSGVSLSSSNTFTDTATDSAVNTLPCFKGSSSAYSETELKAKCGLTTYQIMVEAYRNGGDAKGYGTGWGPSSHTGTIGGVTQSLDYIKDLGANSIWITPVFYTSDTGDEATQKTNATGYFATQLINTDKLYIDPKLGGAGGSTNESLRKLVEAAHGSGMYVFLDGVTGHAKSDFQAGTTTVPSKSSSCRKMNGTWEAAVNYTCFDWNNANTRTYFSDFLKKGIAEYGIDGWRLDQAYQAGPSGLYQMKSAVRQQSGSFTGSADGSLGFTVGEVWSGNADDIESNVFANNALDSAFNFPLRYAIVQTIASQENTSEGWASGQPASRIQTYGYNSMTAYKGKEAMPDAFTDNHDLVRLGDLIQRAGYTSDGSNAEVTENSEYVSRHKLAFALLADYSGPITILYNQEVGDQVPGYVTQPSSCGTGTKWCDDHVSRTSGIYDESSLTAGQKEIRDYAASVLRLRAETPAMYMGRRWYLISDDSIYGELKYNRDGDSRVLFIANLSTSQKEVSVDQSFSSRVCILTGGNGCDSADYQFTGMLDTSRVLSSSSKLTLEPLSSVFLTFGQ